MGLLTVGKPLKWPDSVQFIDYIKKHGIEQFINLYRTQKDRRNDSFKWGDELEYLLISTPRHSKVAKVSMRSAEIIASAEHKMSEDSDPMDGITLHPEYGAFMIEATPLIPYGDTHCDLLLVERNMYRRRVVIERELRDSECLSTMASFPMLGVADFAEIQGDDFKVNGPIAASQFIPDSLINPHPRFGALTRNIRLRRGSAVQIHVPIFRDLNTPKFENSIFMDAMAFGMGNCCVQVCCSESGTVTVHK